MCCNKKDILMKRYILFLIGVLAVCIDNLTFCADNQSSIHHVLVDAGDHDVSDCKNIFLKVWQLRALDGCEEVLQEPVEHVFTMLESWIGQEGKKFIKFLDKDTLAGFAVYEGLDAEQTHIALHAGAFKQEYEEQSHLFIEAVEKEFPKLRKVSLVCASRIKEIHEYFQDEWGFKKDPEYVDRCNPDFLRALKKIPGYSSYDGFSKIIHRE